MNGRACLLAALAAAIAPAPPARAAAASCAPDFPYRQGWLGGDGAASVALSPGRSVWIFGDSFVGRAGQKTRAGSLMIANSVAVSRCESGRWSVSYFWKRRSPKFARAFFDPGRVDFKFWPLDGFLHAGRLYAALLRVREKGKGPFQFEELGVTLARVDNPLDPPPRWRISYRPLSDDKNAFPGVSAVVSGGYVLLYAMLDGSATPKHAMILARVPLKKLGNPAKALQYLAKDGRWKRGLKWRDAAVVIARGAPEMSVRYHPALKRWIAVQNEPAFAAAGIGMRTAPDPAGPWSEYRTFFKIPEMGSGHAAGVFCYAAKEHAEFQGADGAALATYVCNTLDPRLLYGRMDLYRPRAVLLAVP